jgi:hypothetical protein
MNDEFTQKPEAEFISLIQEIKERNQDIVDMLTDAQAAALIGELRAYASVQIRNDGSTVDSFLLPDNPIERLALIGLLQRMIVRLNDVAGAEMPQRCFVHREFGGRVNPKKA